MFRRKKPPDPKLPPRQELFFALDTPAHSLVDALAECTDPHDRAALLEALGHVNEAMAVLHRPAFGPDPLEDEDGRDLADSTWWSGHLLLKMADAERAHATGRPRPRSRWRWQRSPLEHAAGEWLDRLATRTTDHPGHAVLDGLYWAVEPVVGGQAAEAIGDYLYGPQPEPQQDKAAA